MGGTAKSHDKGGKQEGEELGPIILFMRKKSAQENEWMMGSIPNVCRENNGEQDSSSVSLQLHYTKNMYPGFQLSVLGSPIEAP